MAKRKKKSARKISKRASKGSARGRKAVKAKSRTRAVKAKKPRKQRTMHCLAVYSEADPANTAHVAVRDTEGKIVLAEGERICNSRKTKGPRYGYYCEAHKQLSVAAQKAGLLTPAVEPAAGDTAQPIAASAADETAPVDETTSPSIAVTIPAVAAIIDPADGAELANELAAAEEEAEEEASEPEPTKTNESLNGSEEAVAVAATVTTTQ